MTVHMAEPHCVVLTLEGEPNREECLRLVHEALSGAGLPAWEGVEISLFAARNRALLIASPGRSLSVSIAPQAAALLLERFGS